MCQPGRPSPSGVCQRGLSVLLGFPQNEIARVGLIVFVHIDAGAGANAAEVVVRELAVLGKLGDAVVNRTVADIGVAALFELLNRAHHIVDVIGGFDDVFGALQAQGRGVFEERRGVLARCTRRWSGARRRRGG